MRVRAHTHTLHYPFQRSWRSLEQGSSRRTLSEFCLDTSSEGLESEEPSVVSGTILSQLCVCGNWFRVRVDGNTSDAQGLYLNGDPGRILSNDSQNLIPCQSMTRKNICTCSVLTQFLLGTFLIHSRWDPCLYSAPGAHGLKGPVHQIHAQ